MGGLKLLAITASAAAAAAVGFAPARGQCRLCSTPTTAITEPGADSDIQLQIETSIDFDRLVLAGQGEGAAVLRPDGSKPAQGAVAEVGARAMVGTATIHGAPGRAVRVELPAKVELYSLSGGRIGFDQLVSDLPALPRLDSAGNLSFRFGGRITVTGDSEGQYRGELPITVEYQ